MVSCRPDIETANLHRQNGVQPGPAGASNRPHRSSSLPRQSQGELNANPLNGTPSVPSVVKAQNKSSTKPNAKNERRSLIPRCKTTGLRNLPRRRRNHSGVQGTPRRPTSQAGKVKPPSPNLWYDQQNQPPARDRGFISRVRVGGKFNLPSRSLRRHGDGDGSAFTWTEPRE